MNVLTLGETGVKVYRNSFYYFHIFFHKSETIQHKIKNNRIYIMKNCF